MADVGDQQRAASEESARAEAIRSLATTLNKDDGCPTCQLVKGVVTAVSTFTLSANIGGDTSTTIDGIRYFDWWVPQIGDVVQIIKQGSDLVALGVVRDSTRVAAETAANAWTTPTLGSGFTQSSDPVKYRLITQYGEQKIQIRGSCTHTGTNTALWTMPAGFRPVTNRVVLLARDNSQSNAAQLLINSAGTMVLGGATAGVAGSSGGPTGFRTNVDPGTAATGNTDVNHTHRSSDYTGNVQVFSDMWTTTINSGFTNHNHIGGIHQHALDRVLDPTALWFTGIEYFLA
jgi:hypothetical protein